MPKLPEYLRYRDCYDLATRLGFSRYLFQELMKEIPKVYPAGETRANGRRRRAHYRRADVLRAFDPLSEPLVKP